MLIVGSNYDRPCAGVLEEMPTRNRERGALMVNTLDLDFALLNLLWTEACWLVDAVYSTA